MDPAIFSREDPEDLYRQFYFADMLPALLVIEERQRLGHKATYDVFMHEYYGHPTEEDYKEVRHPYRADDHRVFRHRVFERFSPEQGTMVLMRATREYPSSAADYLVITADLYRSAISVWDVVDIRGNGNSKEFILSDAAATNMRSGELAAVPDAPLNTVQCAVAALMRAHALAAAQASQARIILGPEIRGFQRPQGVAELLTGSIAELHHVLSTYYAAEAPPPDMSREDVVHVVGRLATIVAA